MILSTLHSIGFSVIGGVVRRSWLVALMTLTICGGFAAKAWAALQEPEEVIPAAPRAPIAPVIKTKRRVSPDGTELVERNMFCSTCTPTREGPYNPATTFSPDAVLIATSVGSTSARATVRATKSEAQGSWGLGDTIPGVGLI